MLGNLGKEPLRKFSLRKLQTRALVSVGGQQKGGFGKTLDLRLRWMTGSKTFQTKIKKIPGHFQTIRWQPFVQTIGHLPIEVDTIDRGYGSKAMEIEVGIATLQRVKRPENLVVPLGQGPGALLLLQTEANAMRLIVSMHP